MKRKTIRKRSRKKKNREWEASKHFTFCWAFQSRARECRKTRSVCVCTAKDNNHNFLCTGFVSIWGTHLIPIARKFISLSLCEGGFHSPFVGRVVWVRQYVYFVQIFFAWWFSYFTQFHFNWCIEIALTLCCHRTGNAPNVRWKRAETDTMWVRAREREWESREDHCQSACHVYASLSSLLSSFTDSQPLPRDDGGDEECAGVGGKRHEQWK